MHENNTRNERRTAQRAVFSFQENVIGIFCLPQPGEDTRSFDARILNLSVGGLQFSLKKEEGEKLLVGDHLLLKEIQGKDELAFFADLEMVIKWVLEVEYLDHLAFGCKYQGIPLEIRGRIDHYVSTFISEHQLITKACPFPGTFETQE